MAGASFRLSDETVRNEYGRHFSLETGNSPCVSDVISYSHKELDLPGS